MAGTSSKTRHITIRLTPEEKSAVQQLLERMAACGEQSDISTLFREGVAERCAQYGVVYPTELLKKRPTATRRRRPAKQAEDPLRGAL